MSVGVNHSDADARRIIRESIDETVIVEAAAGTGKTTELVTGFSPSFVKGEPRSHEIVAVTFTRKGRWRAEAASQAGFRSSSDARLTIRVGDLVVSRLAVAKLEEAHVSTIHGFCADLLRERPVEARVDPLFRVLTEGQAERLFAEAFAALVSIRLGLSARRRAPFAASGEPQRSRGGG